jgi:hypothetical protein
MRCTVLRIIAREKASERRLEAIKGVGSRRRLTDPTLQPSSSEEFRSAAERALSRRSVLAKEGDRPPMEESRENRRGGRWIAESNISGQHLSELGRETNMTRGEREEQAKQTEQDDLVAKLVPNHSAVPNSVTLVGFQGEGSLPAHRRLYLTADLSKYVEFSEADILHTHRFSSDKARLGYTVVWIKRASIVNVTRTLPVELFARGTSGPLWLQDEQDDPTLTGFARPNPRRIKPWVYYYPHWERTGDPKWPWDFVPWHEDH